MGFNFAHVDTWDLNSVLEVWIEFKLGQLLLVYLTAETVCIIAISTFIKSRTLPK